MDVQGKGKNIQSIQRAIDVISCFDENNIEMSLNDIAKHLDLNKSTVHGIINTLHNNRFIQQNCNGNYMLGQALFDKSVLAMQASKTRLRTMSKSYMTGISNKYKCTTHVFTVNGNRLHFLDMTTPVNSHYIFSVALSSQMQLYCTASGKILLSRMSVAERDEYFQNTKMVPITGKTMIAKEALISNINEIIKKNYSLEDEEADEGCLSIAVPIVTKKDTLVGTLSISGADVKIRSMIEEIAENLQRVSKKLTEDLF
ncbi:MAG: IclR family transcriptional regulator [Peptostreptococcaceae bacterium]|nr:IclR family transcriptional regulator [Peptostreptococcaceae bacterium]